MVRSLLQFTRSVSSKSIQSTGDGSNALREAAVKVEHDKEYPIRPIMTARSSMLLQEAAASAADQQQRHRHRPSRTAATAVTTSASSVASAPALMHQKQYQYRHSSRSPLKSSASSSQPLRGILKQSPLDDNGSLAGGSTTYSLDMATHHALSRPPHLKVLRKLDSDGGDSENTASRFFFGRKNKQQPQQPQSNVSKQDEITVQNDYCYTESTESISSFSIGSGAAIRLPIRAKTANSRLSSKLSLPSFKSSPAAAATVTSKSSQRPRRRIHHHVGFGSVEVRRYDRTVGDNPSCTEGPPVCLDWTYDPNALSYTVDEYESLQEPRRRHGEMALTLPRFARDELLLFEWNVTAAEVAAAVSLVHKVQQQRKRTASQQPSTLLTRRLLWKKRQQSTAAWNKSTHQALDLERQHLEYVQQQQQAQVQHQMRPTKTGIPTTSFQYFDPDQDRLLQLDEQHRSLASHSRNGSVVTDDQSECHSSSIVGTGSINPTDEEFDYAAYYLLMQEQQPQDVAAAAPNNDSSFSALDTANLDLAYTSVPRSSRKKDLDVMVVVPSKQKRKMTSRLSSSAVLAAAGVAAPSPAMTAAKKSGTSTCTTRSRQRRASCSGGTAVPATPTSTVSTATNTTCTATLSLEPPLSSTPLSPTSLPPRPRLSRSALLKKSTDSSAAAAAASSSSPRNKEVYFVPPSTEANPSLSTTSNSSDETTTSPTETPNEPLTLSAQEALERVQL